ncbi:ABC transporter ATP-binding protein [Nitratireductor thuwali]|uniref:Maltose/maltodextrin import ATP-binding protein MalK n=1 Tax=Nitratireductor thuwali TaxID=2267699 RepID=A0ABY5MPV9_9HYPH|nr:Maltose/maltodextrin import ATP-binding protein MalK [Nitratireductor thuwali]
MAQLDISSASKNYGSVRVLDGVNLQIASGEFVVFVGPSGCGKSTLLRMISGLEEISSGTISIDGTVVNNIEPARRGAAMVFQSYALYPHMNVFDNVSFSLRMARLAKPIIRKKVEQAAGILQLDRLLGRRPGHLSGGQKQRVAIGRAIVREPQVFLFDEPLSNLDAELRVQMRAELVDLHRRLNATMIYVTHDQVEAMTLADKMVVMNGGRIQQAGKPLDLYDDPDNRFVAGFIGSPKMNFLSATVARSDENSVTLAGIGGEGTVTLPFRGFDPECRAVEIGLRPEHVSLAESAPCTSVNVCEVAGRVALVEELGDVTYIHVELPDHERLVIRSTASRYRGGSTCRAQMEASRFLLFDGQGQRIRERGIPDA